MSGLWRGVKWLLDRRLDPYILDPRRSTSLRLKYLFRSDSLTCLPVFVFPSHTPGLRSKRTAVRVWPDVCVGSIYPGKTMSSEANPRQSTLVFLRWLPPPSTYRSSWGSKLRNHLRSSFPIHWTDTNVPMSRCKIRKAKGRTTRKNQSLIPKSLL